MFRKIITSGHFQNIPYATTLNAELRNPENATVIRLNSMAEQWLNFQGPKNILLKENADIVKNRLNAEFNNLFPTLCPKTGYRGIYGLSTEQYQKVLNLKNGDIVQDAGFAYFSKYKNVAKDFADGINSVLITCKIPFLSKVSRMFGFIPQYQNGSLVFKKGEFLFPAGSKFKVLKNHINKKGCINLVLKYLK